ncbi:helix-turn-helix domain-containing protein [Actinoallomurus oryzae]|uniref:helix-turn-helix domain-containing protein n=1 Tax=Actinoallomurus oryzae TaxID=502180 RepID=UPI003CD0A209
MAQLAGVSASYYSRLERGHSRGASPEVLVAIARHRRARRVTIPAAGRALLGTALGLKSPDVLDTRGLR